VHLGSQATGQFRGTPYSGSCVDAHSLLIMLASERATHFVTAFRAAAWRSSSAASR
jgi:hypothetical protein